jgi:hypothetical protein
MTGWPVFQVLSCGSSWIGSFGRRHRYIKGFHITTFDKGQPSGTGHLTFGELTAVRADSWMQMHGFLHFNIRCRPADPHIIPPSSIATLLSYEKGPHLEIECRATGESA